MKKLLAQTPHDLGTIGEGEGLGPWSEPGQIANAAGLFGTIISNVIGFMTIFGGLWFMFQLVIGTYSWMSSGGDQARIQTAQRKISNAFIGLVILVAAYALIWLIGELLGFKILQIPKLIQQLGPK